MTSTLAIFIMVVVIAVLIVFGLITYGLYRAQQKEEFIRTYKFPKGLFAKLRLKHPQLSDKDCALVSLAMRKYFLTFFKSKDFVAMPSQVVDDFWHEFILHTLEYQQFCKQAFGRFMHHTPATLADDQQQASLLGMRRCWMWACKEETINPLQPLRLPLLFAIDAKLDIKGGFNYEQGEALVNRLGLNQRRTESSAGGCGGGYTETNGSSSDTGVSDGSGGSSGCGGGGCGGS